MSNEHDSLFAKRQALSTTLNTDFHFDEQVVRVFPDMIARSIPGYELVVPMIGLLARRYAQPDSRIYDLGCSLGAASLAIRLAVRQRGIKIIAVDNSEAMVSQLRKKLIDNNGATAIDATTIDVRLEDMLDTHIHNASVVVLNFTLQFLDREQRQTLINQIAAGMRPGGVLIVSEKICFDSEREQAEQTAWHHDFKRAQGYSDLEIARKRDALEGVLRPDTEAVHFKRFGQAGLSRPCRWFQCFSFTSYIAFR